MKKLVVFFIVFSITLQTPYSAYAQSSPANEVQALSQCYNDVFQRFKSAYETKTGEPLLVDDDLRLQFLTSIVSFKETSSYPHKIASYVVAAFIYASFEKYIYEKMNKFKPIKDIYEAESWDSRGKFLRGKLGEWEQALKVHQDEITRLERATTQQERAELLKNRQKVARLEAMYQDASKRLVQGEKLLNVFESEPAANRWLLTKWSAGFLAVSTVALVILFVALDEVPGVLGVDNNLPVSLEELHEAPSVSEFERLLASTHPEVSSLRVELLQGCKRIQGIDLENWVTYSKGLTTDQIVTSLRDAAVIRDEKPIKVKKQ